MECEVAHIANVEMGNELTRLVENNTIEHDEAITFAHSQSLKCLNALLPPELHMKVESN